MEWNHKSFRSYTPFVGISMTKQVLSFFRLDQVGLSPLHPFEGCCCVGSPTQTMFVVEEWS